MPLWVISNQRRHSHNRVRLKRHHPHHRCRSRRNRHPAGRDRPHNHQAMGKRRRHSRSPSRQVHDRIKPSVPLQRRQHNAQRRNSPRACRRRRHRPHRSRELHHRSNVQPLDRAKGCRPERHNGAAQIGRNRAAPLDGSRICAPAQRQPSVQRLWPASRKSRPHQRSPQAAIRPHHKPSRKMDQSAQARHRPTH